jgi:hypothetical protein
MPTPRLDELLAVAAAADGPAFPPPAQVKAGGVDPLGLRQVNFDLMDRVFPGLNNVARHIRPFVVVTWAARRARTLAEETGLGDAPVADLVDFLDRIEVIYAWSQFLRTPSSDLPGRDVLSSLSRRESYVFGGEDWRKRCEAREFSTAFTAPVNYGPALKSLGWVEAHPTHRRLLIPRPGVDAALDSFEALIVDRLDHAAFSRFGTVEVMSVEVRAWADAWADETITPTEQRTFREMLMGAGAPVARRAGAALMIAAARHAGTGDVVQVRTTMSGRPSNFEPSLHLSAAQRAWRVVQVRQVFRLALESMFSWIMGALADGPKSTSTLVEAFLAAMLDEPQSASVGAWLGRLPPDTSPAELIQRLQHSLQDRSGVDLASGIAAGLAFCLSEPPGDHDGVERADRLPLWRARREAEAWRKAPTREFLGHVIDSWVLGQHVYWSVGRGLADARAGGRRLLRLRVVMDEGGWILAPGATRPIPVPTPDRLQTALSLAKECGLLDSSAIGQREAVPL